MLPCPCPHPAAALPSYTAFTIKSPSLHFAVLTGLAPLTRYYYAVGSPTYGWSGVFTFVSAPTTGPDAYPVTWLAYGDMGISNSENTARLTAQLIQSGAASFITHAGDISYADNRAGIDHGTIYEGVLNDFYNEVQNSSAYAPYMMSSGNHEAILDFVAYRKRVSPTMPQNGGPFWHSYNYGPIHFLAFDIDQAWDAASAQYAFIAADLAAVDRTVTPWVVAYNHFPLICSNYFWCVPSAKPLQELYEPLFNAPATKVDIFYAGHVHAAEVMLPQRNGTVTQTDFVDMHDTLQVMAGFPGDIEVCCNDWVKPKPQFSFWREDDVASDGGLFGFSEWHLANATHLRLRMFDSSNATIVLEQWMSRAV